MPKSRVRKGRGQGKIRLVTRNFVGNVTTYPLMAKVDGKQEPVPGIVVKETKDGGN